TQLRTAIHSFRRDNSSGVERNERLTYEGGRGIPLRVLSANERRRGLLDAAGARLVFGARCRLFWRRLNGTKVVLDIGKF
ncbi:hypothetical protein PFISCL1PPCAC_25440, partial [Pristionchus fissidentatus]